MVSTRDEAIRALHRDQRRARLRCQLPDPISNEDMLARTLRRADLREQNAVRRNGKIRDGLYSFSEILEPVRWSRTRDIIRRVIPGQDEDPVFLEFIARQAASIEIILRQEHTQTSNIHNNQLCDHVLIGTIPTFDTSAYTERTGDYYAVLISVGLIHYLYHVTKALVLCWQPVPPREDSDVGFDNRPETVRHVMDRNPLPLAYFTTTLSGYLFRGRSDEIGYSPPPIEYQYPLVLLANCNERFVLGHEYGHALFNFLDITHPDFLGKKEEFSADIFAFRLLVESGAILDSIPPNASLQSAFLVLTSLRILREALDLVRHGEIHEDRGFLGHPPIDKRMEIMQQLYRTNIDDGSEIYSFSPLLRPAETLSMLWHDAQPYFIRAHADSQQLHAIWKDV